MIRSQHSWLIMEEKGERRERRYWQRSWQQRRTWSVWAPHSRRASRYEVDSIVKGREKTSVGRWHYRYSASDQQSTNDRKVGGLRPTKVVCITVLTGNRMGRTARCGRPPLLLPSCRKLEFRLSALMDSDLAWVNGKSDRQSWRYANAFQRSIISEAIYHLFNRSELDFSRSIVGWE